MRLIGRKLDVFELHKLINGLNKYMAVVVVH